MSEFFSNCKEIYYQNAPDTFNYLMHGIQLYNNESYAKDLFKKAFEKFIFYDEDNLKLVKHVSINFTTRRKSFLEVYDTQEYKFYAKQYLCNLEITDSLKFFHTISEDLLMQLRTGIFTIEIEFDIEKIKYLCYKMTDLLTYVKKDELRCHIFTKKEFLDYTNMQIIFYLHRKYCDI